MTLETLTTITLLTELLLALRANDPTGFRALLEMGLKELGLNIQDELSTAISTMAVASFCSSGI